MNLYLYHRATIDINSPTYNLAINL